MERLFLVIRVLVYATSTSIHLFIALSEGMNRKLLLEGRILKIASFEAKV